MTTTLHLQITHRLAYRYAHPVTFGPQRLQVFPRLSLQQRLIDYTLEVSPLPVSRFFHLDAEGNTAQWLYFDQPADALEIEVRMQVDSAPFNPFDFILYPFESTHLPFQYSPSLQGLLAPYREETEITPELVEWATAQLEAAGGQTVVFLIELVGNLRRDFTYTPREKGAPNLPGETLSTRAGSCRDLSRLMIAACRWAGLAARFVSGYAWRGEEHDFHELHAWVEVYLPGAGWRGFDPTLGAAVAERHVALAASALPHRAAPLRGNFWGEGVMGAELEAGVEVAVIG